MASRIQFRRDTSANWAATNPILAQGELGLETNTSQFKIGNGSTAWNSLSYGGLTGPAGSISAIVAEMAANQAFTATALADITELVASVQANSLYMIEAYVTFQSAATTTGLNLGVIGPSDSRFMGEIVVPLTSTAAATQLRTVFPNAAGAVNRGNVLGTGVTAANSNHTAFVRGILKTTSAGTLQLQAASEVASSAVTLQLGSTLMLTKVA